MYIFEDEKSKCAIVFYETYKPNNFCIQKYFMVSKEEKEKTKSQFFKFVPNYFKRENVKVLDYKLHKIVKYNDNIILSGFLNSIMTTVPNDKPRKSRFVYHPDTNFFIHSYHLESIEPFLMPAFLFE